MLFFFMLMTGTMITISSNSWLSAWMGLEINLLSFIPLMSDNKNLMSSEASLKYFLVQALASAVLLFSIIIYMLKTNFISQIYSNWINSIMIIALMLKSGVAPFHFWFPNVMEGLTWMNSLILMTWQKIAPLMLISYIIMKPIIILGIIFSSIIGALGGLNQTSLRKLMAFSSINHLSWMLAGLLLSESIWMNYFLFYSFLSFIMIYLFNMFKLNHINQLFSMFMNSKNFKFCLSLNLLSLGGLPPFLGFAPKWILIQYLSISTYYPILVLLMLMTLITLYFYLRLCYSAFMLNYTENNWMNKFYSNSFFMLIFNTLSFFSIFGLIILNIIYFML